MTFSHERVIWGNCRNGVESVQVSANPANRCNARVLWGWLPAGWMWSWAHWAEPCVSCFLGKALPSRAKCAVGSHGADLPDVLGYGKCAGVLHFPLCWADEGAQSLSLLPLSGTTILLCTSRVSLLGPYRQYTLNYALAAEGIALSITPHALILH